MALSKIGHMRYDHLLGQDNYFNGVWECYVYNLLRESGDGCRPAHPHPLN